MSFPFKGMPTLREFVYAAVQQGCKEREVPGIVGARGPAKARYLVGAGPNAPIVILPNVGDSVRLTPTVLANLVRTLGVTGYEDCVIDESKSYTYLDERDSDQPTH